VHPAPDPVVHLSGGPGASALTAAPYLFTWVISPYLANRDIVFFDQRGTGASQPALNCPVAINPDVVSLDPQLLECRDRLIQEGVNLAGYTSAESAADVDDLRRALGYAQWNLWGVSYGTRLTLAVMRDFPDGIRSVILDSTIPPQINAIVEGPAKVDGVLTTLFTGCAADRACNAAYPELRRVLYQLVAQLNRQPAPLVINVAGESQDITLNGNRLLVLVVQALSDTERIPALPQAIYTA
jgi:pimeloyl-ACP methyl ester carboxylesterase